MNVALLQQAGQQVQLWPRTLLLSHDRPDGDAYGAMAAMWRVITAAGRQATACIYGDCLPRYAFLTESCPFERCPLHDPAQMDAGYDGILIVDTGSWSQLEPAADYLRASRLPRIVLDHHATWDALDGQGTTAIYAGDASSASACGLLFDWCRLMNWPIDQTTAEDLFVGIATDTGWFRFSNTDDRTLTAAAQLLRLGVKADMLYARLYESWTPARLRLKALLLATLQLHAEGRVAGMILTPDMLQVAGATPADCEELINEPMAAAQVVASVLFNVLEDGRVRVNLRSKSPEVCGRDVDVSALAKELGGGGHRRAAGVRVAGPLERAQNEILPKLIAAVTSG
ncbi:MAG: hypothetical protein GXY55_12050 [Phycisphaerae bacterium]|nr:hypothetical protein [Phycisphaerae bacterium]